jgi:N-methylhydantoinase A
MLVGVDIGGTFTDFCVSVNGRLEILKLLSTPRSPATAMLEGLATLSSGRSLPIERVLHGSTVATNAILERNGARTALITTQGFRDILFIGRQDRPLLYALQPQIPRPLVPRRWCYEVPERLDHTGTVLQPLDVPSLDAILSDIEREEIESVAVCLLYSYVSPIHEQDIRARILQRGLLTREQIALSSEVLPEYREYERASTVVLEAYVRPVVTGYLGRLEQALSGENQAKDGDLGRQCRPMSRYLRVLKSDGGVISAQRAREQAVQTVLSGPAAGAIGGFYTAQLAGYDHVVTLDMGGTSTDVALCPGDLIRRSDAEIDGLPLRTRVLDIETIGAGGGSIARLDAGGALRVGPESAAADPGPIAYGLGGRQVTVTDANLLLGRLDAKRFLGGAMPLYPEPARAALEDLAKGMGVSIEAAALGVIAVANVNVDRALRRVSLARGYDPRRFTLVAFGGAGPLHACEVAEGLGIPRVLVPRHPGVLCAFGLLMADVVLETSLSVLSTVSAGTVSAVQTRLAEMVSHACADLAHEGIAREQMVFDLLVDARYEGQSYELTIPFSDTSADKLCQDFHAAHARSYGHDMPDRAVEIVNLRLLATGLVGKPVLACEPLVPNDGSHARFGQRSICLRPVDRGIVEESGVVGAGPGARIRAQPADLYDRARLRPGARCCGPALLFQLDSTVYVPPAWAARVDGYRNLVLERQE